MSHFTGSIDVAADRQRLDAWLADAGPVTLWHAAHFSPDGFEVRGAVLVCGTKAHEKIAAVLTTTIHARTMMA